jgi:hypothetical protein
MSQGKRNGGRFRWQLTCPDEGVRFPFAGARMHDLNPSQFRLSQNHPNPFNEHTTIKFCVPYRTKVTLEVFDPEGKIVRTLIEGEKDAGTYEIEFSARDATGGAEREPLLA